MFSASSHGVPKFRSNFESENHMDIFHIFRSESILKLELNQISQILDPKQSRFPRTRFSTSSPRVLKFCVRKPYGYFHIFRSVSIFELDPNQISGIPDPKSSKFARTRFSSGAPRVPKFRLYIESENNMDIFTYLGPYRY